MVPEQQRLLQTFAVLIASALERLHLARSAEEASWTPSANSCATRCWRRCRTICARR